MHTPGHTSGSISIVGDGRIFSGDTLFAGSVGRTDFPESSNQKMRISLEKIKDLKDNLIVCPGHGPMTNLETERHNNPFLKELL